MNAHTSAANISVSFHELACIAYGHNDGRLLLISYASIGYAS